MKIQFPYQAPPAKEGPCTWHCEPHRGEPRPASPASPAGCYGPDGPLRPPAIPAAGGEAEKS